MPRIWIPFAAALAAIACSSSGGDVACRAGADCASGICLTNGTCAPVTSSDASIAQDAPSTSDAQSYDASGYDASQSGCVPNDDGTITAAEAPLGPGLHAKFRVAQNATVSTAGTTQNDGSRVWDLTASLSGDQDVEIDTNDVSGAWFAPQFATASYSTLLSPTSTLLGVFRFGGDALALEGVASPSQSGAYTEVTYSPEALMVQFPMTMNSTWSSNSTVSGTASGIPAYYEESYQSKVDAYGSIKTPYGTFQVLRIATVLTRTVGATVTITRSFGFFAECATQVATIVSQADEPTEEFTNAAIVERLTP